MVPLLLSTSDERGGAARAASRLHDGLRHVGVDAQMLVQEKSSGRASVHGPASKVERGWAKLRPYVERLPLEFYPDRDDRPFHIQWLPDRLSQSVRSIDPDVIHLHWICGGFLQIETLASFNRPIVWTLHDMWAMTGGCHYSGACDGYKNRCGNCPHLGSSSGGDFSRLTWLRKKNAWENADITFVTPSRWLAECARSSSLLAQFPVEVISYGIDLDAYKPMDKTEARRLFNLPEECPLVLFGAMNPTKNSRKGFDLLLGALEDLQRQTGDEDLRLVVFGNSSSENVLPQTYPVHYLGTYSDDTSLAALYSAVDVFVAPSRQDNLPLAVQESLACGSPVVAFDVGGMPDMITHQHNGYLAEPFDVQDLASGIKWCLGDSARRKRLSENARSASLERFDLEDRAQDYCELYDSLL